MKEESGSQSTSKLTKLSLEWTELVLKVTHISHLNEKKASHLRICTHKRSESDWQAVLYGQLDTWMWVALKKKTQKADGRQFLLERPVCDDCY